jgi:hypothetical protein
MKGEESLEVRGNINLDKFKAAQVLGGDQVKFELRAMKPVKAGQLSSSCIVCLICIVCVVCSTQVAEQHNLKLREYR